jgi:hypothetical protein
VPVAFAHAAANAAWSCRTFEADVGFPAAAVRAAVPEPPVVDAETAGPSDTPIDHDATYVGAILRQVQGRQLERSKRHHNGGPEIIPKPRVRAISLQGDLHLVRRKKYGPGEHGDAERELGLARRHRSAVGPDALDMPNGSTTRYMLDTDERGKRNDADERPAANPRESGRTYVRMPWTIAEDAEAVGLMRGCDRRVALPTRA